MVVEGIKVMDLRLSSHWFKGILMAVVLYEILCLVDSYYLYSESTGVQ